MAATAMDPVDIANILAQELLYQQVMVKMIARSTKISQIPSQDKLQILLK